MNNKSSEREVLPEIASPLHYDLYLKPNLNTFEFTGHVQITILFEKDSETITLNNNQLKILNASLLHSNRVEKLATIVQTETDDKKQETTFTMDRMIPVKTMAILSISFEGVLSEELAGFYRSKVEDKKYLAVTQFEATDARRAFPCWDEPNKKATFSVCLDVQETLTALSNMDVKKEYHDEDDRMNAGDMEVEAFFMKNQKIEKGWKRVLFNKSPIMSTYLVAFVVGDISYVEGITKNQVRFRVYSPPKYIHQADFALNVGMKTLDFFTEYFDQEYPLPKMDMIAIPDFAFGAMENWGLVTYRMTLLLFDEKSSSLATKKRVAYVIGHELAHQWFGNLVTMDWWSDLWLNEGFATWVGWLASDYIFPEWNVWMEFILDDFNQGLHLDSLRSSHPIEVPVQNPADISQIFDAISYSKGASVIRMLESYLGRQTFQQGLRLYLKKHKFGNACTNDLWECLTKSSGKDVQSMMNGWTRQVGYPMLKVTRDVQDEQWMFKLTQERFLPKGEITEQDVQLKWKIPLNLGKELLESKQVTMMNDDEKNQSNGLILEEKEGMIKIGNAKSFEGWKLKFNRGQVGFYRVQYDDDDMIQRFGEGILKGGEHEQGMAREDRLGILNDMFTLGYGGHQSITKGLNFLNYFEKEKDYVVLSEIYSQLNRLKSMCFEEDEMIRKCIEKLILSKFLKSYQRYGWEFTMGEKDSDALLRSLSLSACGLNGYDEVIREGQRRFELFVQGNESMIHPNIQGFVFSMVVKYGGVKEYEAVLRIYQESVVFDQKNVALSALGMTRDANLIHRTLSMTLSDMIRTQDLIYIFSSLSSNGFARRLTWNFIEEHWKTYYERLFDGSISLISRIVMMSSHLTTFNDAERVTNFFQGKKIEGISRSIEQSIEKIRRSATWIKNDLDQVKQWLISSMN